MDKKSGKIDVGQYEPVLNKLITYCQMTERYLDQKSTEKVLLDALNYYILMHNEIHIQDEYVLEINDNQASLKIVGQYAPAINALISMCSEIIAFSVINLVKSSFSVNDELIVLDALNDYAKKLKYDTEKKLKECMHEYVEEG